MTSARHLQLETDLPEPEPSRNFEISPDQSLDTSNLVSWLDSLALAIPEGIALIDSCGKIAYFSAGAEKITGWNREELREKSVFEIFSFRDGEKWLELAGCEPLEECQAEALHRDGFPLPVNYCLVRPVNQNVESKTSILVFRDSREEVAARKLRAFFLANITHEFRTPLSSLNASVEFLLEEIQFLSKDEIEALLTSIHLSVTGLQTLIDNLLESIQIEAGRFNISPRTSDLEKIITEAQRVMSPILTRRRQILKIHKPEKLSLVECDPTRITQVLVNLLSNASKYGPTQQEIRVKVEPVDENWIKISVIDHGPGIPSQEKDKIFQQYYRLGTKSNAQDGIGLGLWVVRVIVEGHGGNVGVREAPGVGSIFWFTVPSVRKTA